MPTPRGVYPNHWYAERRPSHWNRLGRFLRVEWLYLNLLLLLFATCALGGQEQDGEQQQKGRPAMVWFAPEAEQVLRSGFAAFETDPNAPRLLCMADVHTFPSQTQPNTLVIAVFEVRHETVSCGKDSAVMYFPMCPQVSPRLQDMVNKSGVKMLLLACKKARGEFWFHVVLPQTPRA